MFPGKQNSPQLRTTAMTFPQTQVFELTSAINHQINPINAQLPFRREQDADLLLLHWRPISEVTPNMDSSSPPQIMNVYVQNVDSLNTRADPPHTHFFPQPWL